MAQTIQVRRGAFASLPTLAAGELGFCTDTYQVFVGDGATNHEVGGSGGLTYITESYDETYNTVQLLATHGVDANVSIALQPKGAGALQAQLATGNATGGNTRGQYAVDLQMSRNAAAQVASAHFSSLCGGDENIVAGQYSFVGAGLTNNIESGSDKSVIVGGSSNSITNTSDQCFIGGGASNEITDNYAVIVGGWSNHAYADKCFVGGGASNEIAANSDYGVICGGNLNNILASELYSAIVGGYDNDIDGDYSFIGSGSGNDVAGDYSVVCGGTLSYCEGHYSFVGGGNNNDMALADYSFIGGGLSNYINGSDYAVIVGGNDNEITKDYGVIVGGKEAKIENVASEAISFGKFAALGDSQTMKTVAKGTSTNDSVAELLVNGVQLLLPTSGTDKAWNFTIEVVALDAINNNANYYWYHGGIKNIAGTTTLTGSAVSHTAIEDDGTVTGIVIVADDGTNALKITFQGSAGDTWQVTATIRITQTFV